MHIIATLFIKKIFMMNDEVKANEKKGGRVKLTTS